MNSFKFRFFAEDNVNTVAEELPLQTEWVKCKEIPADNQIMFKDLECRKNTIKCGAQSNQEIKYFRPDDVPRTIDSNLFEETSVLKAERSHSDLLTALYEGGLKIWECTYDLINYIEDSEIDLNGRKVMDLGCGAGIVGILCCLKGACCYFQDYNEEVIKYLTIPNVMLNQTNEINSLTSNCKFYSGDWDSFVDVLDFREENDKFEYIFTSETIYNTQSYDKLIRIFKHCLKKTGVIYLAAKSYYFGVGGSLTHFEDRLKKEMIFTCNRMWKCEEGIQREILKINFNMKKLS